MGLDLKDIVWVSKAPSFENSGLGRALTSEEYLNRYTDEAGNFVPMTSDNMNNAEEMALNLFGADDAVIRIVSGNDGPTDDPKNGGEESYSVGEVLGLRIAQLEQQEKNGGLDANQKYNLALYTAMSKNRRFSNLQISDCVDYYSESNLSDMSHKKYHSYTKMAMYYLPTAEELEKVQETEEQLTRKDWEKASGETFVTYAGTGPELASWMEDGRMATTKYGVSAQQASAEYLAELMKKYPNMKFTVCGYSKGGSEALYAAIMQKDADRARIYRLRNYDGPGFGDELQKNTEFSENYGELKKQLGKSLYCLSPQNSVIGHLMNNHETYVYFKSADQYIGDGAFAHDSRFWEYKLDGDLITTDENGEPLQRTELSEFYEKLLESMLKAVGAHGAEHLFDDLENFAWDHGIVGMWQLSDFVMSEDPETGEKVFDLDKAVGNYMDFVKSLDAEGLKNLEVLIDTIASPSIIAEAISMFSQYVFQREGSKMGAWVTGIITAPVLQRLVRVILKSVTAIAAIYTVTKWFLQAAQQIELTVSELYEKIKNGLEILYEQSQKLVEKIVDRLKETQLYKDIREILSAPNLVEMVITALAKKGESTVRTVEAIDQAVQQVLSTLVQGIKNGSSPVGEFFSGIRNGCMSLLERVRTRLQGFAGRLTTWSWGIHGRDYDLKVDHDGLQETVRLLRLAGEKASGLSSRVSSISAGISAEAAMAAAQGNPFGLVNNIRMSIVKARSNHYGEILSMTEKVERIDSEYERTRDRVRAALPGTT